MINAHIGLTYKCNMNCNHCYVKSIEKSKSNVNENLLLQRLKELGTFFITYTLGENLLYDNFFCFAQKAKELGFYQILLTNGYIIDNENIVSQLENVGIKKIGISIDSSSEEKHNCNRNKENAFQKAFDAIEILKRNSMIDVQINMTINNNNINEIFDVIEKGSNYGVLHYSFLWQRNSGKVEQIMDKKKYEEYMMKLFVFMEKNKQYQISIHDYQSNYIGKKLLMQNKISNELYEDIKCMNHCHALDELVLIEPSGDMHRCNFETKAFGNIYDENLFEIINKTNNDKYICRGCIQ